MNDLLNNYLLSSISENKIPHAFLVETNNFETLINDIYSIFISNKLLFGNKIENCPNILVMKPDTILDPKDEDKKTKIIDKDKILYIQKYLTTKAIDGGYKIYFICNSELMNEPAANKLLKVLEEPGEKSIGFLLTTDSNTILPTIKSRCEYFKLSGETIIDDQLILLADRVYASLHSDFETVYLLKKELLGLEKRDLLTVLKLLRKKYEVSCDISNEQIKIIANNYKIVDNIISIILANGSPELSLDRLFIELR